VDNKYSTSQRVKIIRAYLKGDLYQIHH